MVKFFFRKGMPPSELYQKPSDLQIFNEFANHYGVEQSSAQIICCEYYPKVPNFQFWLSVQFEPN